MTSLEFTLKHTRIGVVNVGARRRCVFYCISFCFWQGRWNRPLPNPRYLNGRQKSRGHIHGYVYLPPAPPDTLGQISALAIILPCPVPGRAPPSARMPPIYHHQLLMKNMMSPPSTSSSPTLLSGPCYFQTHLERFFQTSCGHYSLPPSPSRPRRLLLLLLPLVLVLAYYPPSILFSPPVLSLHPILRLRLPRRPPPRPLLPRSRRRFLIHCRGLGVPSRCIKLMSPALLPRLLLSLPSSDL